MGAAPGQPPSAAPLRTSASGTVRPAPQQQQQQQQQQRPQSPVAMPAPSAAQPSPVVMPAPSAAQAIAAAPLDLFTAATIGATNPDGSPTLGAVMAVLDTILKRMDLKFAPVEENTRQLIMDFGGVAFEIIIRVDPNLVRWLGVGGAPRTGRASSSPRPGP
jgi:hypothetical protein